jgi:hypothetical protein
MPCVLDSDMGTAMGNIIGSIAHEDNGISSGSFIIYQDKQQFHHDIS